MIFCPQPLGYKKVSSILVQALRIPSFAEKVHSLYVITITGQRSSAPTAQSDEYVLFFILPF